MIVILYILNLLLCVWMAKQDANKIKQGIKVNHAVNGAIHLLTGCLIVIIYGWPHFIAWLCECRIVFDISLSLFRGLNPFYVSPKPASLVDRVEKSVFWGNGFLPKIIYLIIFIVCLLISK